ncbi:MAG: hypothetical protein R3C09_20325 [Pirellulaceae bacterium]
MKWSEAIFVPQTPGLRGAINKLATDGAMAARPSALTLNPLPVNVGSNDAAAPVASQQCSILLLARGYSSPVDGGGRSQLLLSRCCADSARRWRLQPAVTLIEDRLLTISASLVAST